MGLIGAKAGFYRGGAAALPYSNVYSMLWTGASNKHGLISGVTQNLRDETNWGFSTWMRFSSTASGTILFGQAHPTDAGAYWYLAINNSEMVYNVKGSGYVSTGTTIRQPYDTWSHYMWTVSQSGTIDTVKFYRDGVQIGIAITISPRQANFAVGGWTSLNGLRFAGGLFSAFNGVYSDETAFFAGVTPTDTDVARIYNSGVPYNLMGDALAGNIVFYTRYEEGSGTNVADSSGNGHDTTLVNSPAFSTDVP